jgi:predicted GH43/DUF377 family glycosyl hydrolase
MKSHAQVPTLLIKEDRLRVYFSSRPKKNISLTTFVDIDIDDFSKILYLHPKPILKLGSPGTFDEHGIMPSSVVENDGLVYLYYSGWSRGHSLPYSNYTGLAISEDGGNTFKKFSYGPIIDRTPFELYSATSPCVYFENEYWHMWYCSGTKWLKINGKFEHTYDIKYAHSTDGIKWLQKNKTIINPKNKYEAITKPSVIKLDNKYHMWYCYRGSKDFRNGNDGYRIGYAYSEDLQNWTRYDKKVGIKVSDAGWDSKMIAYPAVAKVKDEIIMIYNGNNFGAEGFGYAVLDTYRNCYER